MRKCKLSIFMCFFLMGACFVSFSLEVFAKSIYKEYWVAVEKAPIFNRPNGVSDGEYKWAERVLAYGPKLKSAPAGWIPLLKYQANPSSKNSYYWLRREDLWDKMPRKVVACWPIKRIEYIVGHWAVVVDFKPDGSGIAEELISIAEGNLGPYKTHVFMSQNIVQLNALDKDRRNLFTAGYKPEDRHMYPNGTKEWTKQALFDENELKGCSVQPTVKK